MHLTMRYLELYPDSELHIIRQMLNNAIMFSANLIAQVDADEQVALSTPLSEEQRLSAAEDTSVYEDFLDEVDQLAVQMTVIALHSLGEKTLKRIARKSSTFGADIDRAGIKTLKKAFLDLSLDLEKVSEFEVFNEVRCVANSIKHSGLISQELAEVESPLYGKPVVGKPIKVAALTLDLYYKHVSTFLDKVCQLAAA